MALLHKATITPGKLELLSRWLPTQAWFGDDEPDLEQLGAYRFDDPDGEVGIETFLLGDAAGRTLHVPVTYRGAPLEGGDAWLIGTMEHSVLGRRWVYDAEGDPVYAAVLTSTILSGGTQAELEREADGVRTPVESTATVRGSGSPDVQVGPVDIGIVRVIEGEPPAGIHTLTGTWSGVDAPVVLAVARTV